MLKLKLKQTLNNLENKPVKDSEGNVTELGKVMANAMLTSQTTQDPTRNYLLATKMYQDEELLMTADDLEYIKKQIKDSAGQTLPILFKGQILHILDMVDKIDEEKQTKQS